VSKLKLGDITELAVGDGHTGGATRLHCIATGASCQRSLALLELECRRETGDMKAVMANVPEHILEWRRRTGADQWDEMWEGVLHMAPSPNREHQDFEGALEAWLRWHWAATSGGRVYHQINVSERGTWPNNYRIPDLVLLTPSRFGIDCNEYFDGGPDVAVEIRSPGDEAYEKLEFYAKVGVQEVWILDRDSRFPELLTLRGNDYQACESSSEGWLHSRVADVEFRVAADEKFEIRLSGRDDTLARLP
jgi:Uma2 family endonuclease